MSANEAVEAAPEVAEPDVAALIPMVRRIIYARVADRTVAEDLVQETLAKVLGAAHRVEPGMLEPYAIVTARHLVASLWKEQDRHGRNEHRVVDLVPVPAPDEEIHGLLLPADRERGCDRWPRARLRVRPRQQV